MRILRHPQPLWAPAAHEDAAAADRELDFIMALKPAPASLYLVDDNFIGNRKAARQTLPHLVDWQKKSTVTRYPFHAKPR
jgi:hypothetical protein